MSYFLLSLSISKETPLTIASVRVVCSLSAQSLINCASPAVTRILRLMFRGFSLRGRPVLGLIPSPTFCPCNKYNVARAKSQEFFSIFFKFTFSRRICITLTPSLVGISSTRSPFFKTPSMACKVLVSKREVALSVIQHPLRNQIHSALCRVVQLLHDRVFLQVFQTFQRDPYFARVPETEVAGHAGV